MLPFLAVAALFLWAIGGKILARTRRRRLLTAIRASWGKSGARTHKFDAIRAASRSRFATLQEVPSVDERTWMDLDLNDVFAAIDRTESTLGQQALYHRLHTSPDTSDRIAFEALVTRMATDSETRERAQMALARLQDAHGYNIWWL